MPTPRLYLATEISRQPGATLPRALYERQDVVQIARELLGKVICTALPGGYTAGIIVETEAYSGRADAACHAHLGRRTGRNQIMYSEPGLAYVYLCYGLHALTNIVTSPAGQADAVLLRAIEPLEGLDIMATRRGRPEADPALGRGPGSMSMALGITTAHYGMDFQGPDLWIEDRGLTLAEAQIKATTRIGVDYAGADAWLPWRFVVAGSPFVSAYKKPGGLRIER